ncbi:MAG TPA: penicillin-binding protein activator, partial [Paraburkholderia sp.]
EFSRDDCATVAENDRSIAQRVENSMTRLVKNQRPRFAAQRFEMRPARRRLRREKSFEHEPVRRQSRNRQRGDGGARPGYGADVDTGLARGAHESESRITDQRRSRIADQRDVRTVSYTGDEIAAGIAFVMFVQRDATRADAEMPQQRRAVTRVFGSDQIDTCEHIARARRQILEIADRRCDDPEFPRRCRHAGFLNWTGIPSRQSASLRARSGIMSTLRPGAVMSAPRLPRLLVCGTVALCALFTGCAELPEQESPPTADASAAEQAYQQGDFDHAAQQFLDAAYASPREAAHFKLRAAEAYRENGELEAAAQALNAIKAQRLNPDESVRLSLVQAEIDLSRHAPQQALQALDYDFNTPSLPPPFRVRVLELRARAFAANGDIMNSARTRIELDRYLAGGDRRQNEQQIVALLQQAPPDALKRQAASLPPGDTLRPWLDQALRKSGQALPQVVLRPNEPVGTYVPTPNGEQREGYRQVHRIALLLPEEGPVHAVAQPIRDGFFAAHFADTNPQRAEIYIYDSGSAPAEAVTAYQL